MKRIGIVAMTALLTASSYGVILTQDTQELAVSGVLDFDTINKTYFAVAGKYGYFFWDNIEFGGRGGYKYDDAYRQWYVGLLGEYDFDFSGLGLIPEIVPFVAASINVAGTSYDFTVGSGAAQEQFKDSDNGLVFGGEVGCKYFITEAVAISGSFLLDMATGDIYPSDDGLKKVDARLNLGMSYYY